MRAIFMGNPEFALPTLKALLSSRHDVVAVVSNPPKPIGRGRKLRSTAVGQFAKENNLNLIETESLKSAELHDQLSALKPDVFVVVAYRILPKSLIDLPKYGAVNLHASLLPKYRGAGPIQWSLMNGDKTTGVTVFQINPWVDRGEILLQKEMDIFPDDDMLSLGMRLCNAGANLIVDALDRLENGTIHSWPQKNDLAISAPKITMEMTVINWTWPAEKIHNWIRGLSPRPGMSTTLNGKNFRIYKTKVLDMGNGRSGEIKKIKNDEMVVSTGKGALSLMEVQAEGKRKMPIGDFLHGAVIQVGDRLGE
ncbi:MAG TPA: methionyl-tRNA formyltransferase [Candidatus Marinimicrobia bacterium]|nr:methionyl-tRNA formyltransferase [Candidatus Neomarinimicrobiota bacterium]